MALPGPDDDPITALTGWLASLQQAGVPHATAMVLASVDADGRPDARTVLLRSLDERGITFHTDLHSPKSRQLAARPDVAATFAWNGVERQVRVRGTASVLTEEEADADFARRPRRTQVASWAAHQSEPIASRDALRAQLADAERRFPLPDARAPAAEVPRPPRWGGWRIAPDEVEFWVGSRDRLHDRLAFTRTVDGWSCQRLQP